MDIGGDVQALEEPDRDICLRRTEVWGVARAPGGRGGDLQATRLVAARGGGAAGGRLNDPHFPSFHGPTSSPADSALMGQSCPISFLQRSESSRPRRLTRPLGAASESVACGEREWGAAC